MKYDLSSIARFNLDIVRFESRIKLSRAKRLSLYHSNAQWSKPQVSFTFNYAVFFSSRHLSVLRFLWRLSKSSVCSTLVANSSNLLTFCGIVTRLRYWIFRQGLAGFLRFFLAFGFSPVFLRRARRRCIPNLASLRRFVFRDSDSSFRRLRCFSARLKYLT